ncbi:MAG: hypothetical protein MJ176_03360 [Treponema sp.]|nr:hypothetical protein [Treponema sp.]
MIKLDVTISNNTLQILTNAFSGRILDKDVMQATKSAFAQSAHLLKGEWGKWAEGGSLPGAENIKTPSTNLAQSIRVHEKGPFDYIVGTNSRNMERIVEGQKAYDMKETYPFARKSRRTKDGRGYLIIPFRWGTPNDKGGARAHYRNVIPKELKKIVERFKVTINTKEHHLEPNYRGELIERQEYFWGDRLNDEDAGMANGMVRMAGGGGYFTFRIITEKNMFNGNKWWKKAVPPNDVLSALVRNNEKAIGELIDTGILTDLNGKNQN